MALQTIAFTSTGNAADSLIYSEEADAFTRDSIGLNAAGLETAFAHLQQWALQAESTRWVTIADWLDSVLADLLPSHPLFERCWLFRRVCAGKGAA
jgi:hypothetical protein